SVKQDASSNFSAWPGTRAVSTSTAAAGPCRRRAVGKCGSRSTRVRSNAGVRTRRSCRTSSLRSRAADRMRATLTIVHRLAGLAIAGFLFVSGLTGAVISWDHELDEILNTHLTKVDARGELLPPLELARLVEERDPRVRVTYFPLEVAQGDSFVVSVEPRVDP